LQIDLLLNYPGRFAQNQHMTAQEVKVTPPASLLQAQKCALLSKGQNNRNRATLGAQFAQAASIPGDDKVRTLATLYTIGHSTRSFDELVRGLAGHGITTLVDVRSFPMSRRLPHFNRESLQTELPQRGITYIWMRELGGRRKKVLPESPNVALRNESFRNYADYMMTDEFAQAIERLLEIASRGKTAYMCAERVYFRCHRMLISDYLAAHGHTVVHIVDEVHEPRPHQLMSEARLVNGKLMYNGEMLL
jgi:hypothetical protein